MDDGRSRRAPDVLPIVLMTSDPSTTAALLATSLIVAILLWIFVRRRFTTPSAYQATSPRAPLQTVAASRELYLNAAQAERCLDARESISLGDSLLTINALATEAECKLLLEAAEAAVEVRSKVRAGAGGVFSRRQPRFRMPIINFLFSGTPGRALCDELLRRALMRLSEALPGFVEQRLGEATEAALHAGIVGNRQLQFSEGEPAINVYYPGGEFAPHEDKQRLTVLIALSDAASGAFTGGGTAFWSEQDRGPDGARARSSPPSVTVHAPAGSALIFCG